MNTWAWKQIFKQHYNNIISIYYHKLVSIAPSQIRVFRHYLCNTYYIFCYYLLWSLSLLTLTGSSKFLHYTFNFLFIHSSVMILSAAVIMIDHSIINVPAACQHLGLKFWLAIWNLYYWRQYLICTKFRAYLIRKALISRFQQKKGSKA